MPILLAEWPEALLVGKRTLLHIVVDALETAMTTFPGMAEKFFSSVENKKKFDRKD